MRWWTTRSGASRNANRRDALSMARRSDDPITVKGGDKKSADPRTLAEEFRAHRNGYFGACLSERTLHNGGHVINGARGNRAADDDRVGHPLRR